MTNTPKPKQTSHRDRIPRIFALLLGTLFVLQGGLKLLGSDAIVAAFAGWGYPTWFLYAVGALELVTAILLLVPRTTALGAFLVLSTMAGALLTHAQAGEWTQMAFPLGVALVAALVAWHFTPVAMKARLKDLDHLPTP